MHRYRIALTTLQEISEFAERVSNIGDEVNLENKTGKYRLRAKSVIGIIAAVQDWDELWVVSNSCELYDAVSKYVV